MAQLIQECWAQAPRQRPGCAQVMERLQRLLHEVDGTTPPAPSPPLMLPVQRLASIGAVDPAVNVIPEEGQGEGEGEDEEEGEAQAVLDALVEEGRAADEEEARRQEEEEARRQEEEEARRQEGEEARREEGEAARRQEEARAVLEAQAGSQAGCQAVVGAQPGCQAAGQLGSQTAGQADSQASSQAVVGAQLGSQAGGQAAPPSTSQAGGQVAPSGTSQAPAPGSSQAASQAASQPGIQASPAALALADVQPLEEWETEVQWQKGEVAEVEEGVGGHSWARGSWVAEEEEERDGRSEEAGGEPLQAPLRS
ncbi:hypothetical protein FOA52_007763 [Chlamydomonas sp. UWO 241]|nr:hypothetical protein FOA52_007763 [Chlamydomonas sp. UWO 241]